MRPSSLRKLCASLLASAFLAPVPAGAEDIDLFTNPAPNAATAPNVLIIIDNSANWAANNQAWATGKQGALYPCSWTARFLLQRANARHSQ